MDELRPAISRLEQKLEAQLKDVAETKKAINLLLKMGGEPPRYTDIDSGGAVALAVRSDMYYGQPLSSVVGDVLTRNKSAGGGAMSVNEIYDAMVKGGYKFETQSDDNAKRGLRISLTKNSTKFHRVPNGNWGLREWYPNVKAERVPIDDDNESGAKVEKRVDENPAMEAEEPVMVRAVKKEQAPDAA